MRRNEYSDKSDQNMKVIRRILSGNFLDVHLNSERYQLVNIRILNLIGESKVSVWEEIYSGTNSLTIDISSLMKGPYKIIINYPEDNLKEEAFTIC